MYQRISKATAKKMFAAGETVYLCPCKMRPGGGWSDECPVTMTPDLIQNALRYKAYYDEVQTFRWAAARAA